MAESFKQSYKWFIMNNQKRFIFIMAQPVNKKQNIEMREQTVKILKNKMKH